MAYLAVPQGWLPTGFIKYVLLGALGVPDGGVPAAPGPYLHLTTQQGRG